MVSSFVLSALRVTCSDFANLHPRLDASKVNDTQDLQAANSFLNGRL